MATSGVLKWMMSCTLKILGSIAVLIKRDHPNNSIRIRVSKPGALRNAKDVGIIIER